MISVIIPVYNCTEFLESALASVQEQEFSDREVLLIDDGSPACLQPPPGIHYIRQPHLGVSVARNRGIRESHGEFLAFLDADDLWMAGHLTRLHAVLLANPDAGIAHGCMRQIAEGRISGTYRMPYLQSCLFRRSVFEICGGFDETMNLGEDYDLMYRCWERDILKINLPDVSFLYRRHSGNTTRGQNVRAQAMLMQRRIARIRSGELDPAQPRRFLFRDYIGHIEGANQWTAWSAS